MLAANTTKLLRLPPPAGPGVRCLSAAPVRAHVWLEARNFFTRDSAQQFCWLWMLGADGRVHALRVPAACAGDERFANSLLAHFTAQADVPFSASGNGGLVLPLPAAPIVPLPRWHVSWGHPLQQALREFAARLDHDVLAALGALEVQGTFFGSVANYNRLAVLPDVTRRHRLQALAEFPPLVAPLLLDAYGRPDMFGADEDEPQQSAALDHAAGTPALDAMDRGRDLVGALAAHFRIRRALVRAPMLREPWCLGSVPHDVLQLLEALPPQARPQTRAAVEDRLPLLRALPLRLRGPADAARLAAAFAAGWNQTWQALGRHAPGPPAAYLRDTRDFLRAALDYPAAVHAPVPLDMERLCLAWIARRGLVSLLDASARWHAQPLVPQPRRAPASGLPDQLVPILGDGPAGAVYRLDADGEAREALTANDLFNEGETMHHCVGGYWHQCVMNGVRIVHLTTADGETATAEYRPAGWANNPTFKLEALRGPYNANPSHKLVQLAQKTAEALNAPALRARRIAVAKAVGAARAQGRPSAAPVAVRHLDRRSQHELRLVLAWCGRQADWQAAVDVLLRAAVRGFEHAEGPQVFPQLAPGDALQLVREPANPHDARAVRIDWCGHKLGYVPRGDNADIARRLDAGETLAANISTVAQQASAWDAVEFEIAAAPVA